MKHKSMFLKFMRLMGKRLPKYLLAIFMMTAFSSLFDVVGSILVKLIFDIAQSKDITELYYELPINIVAALLSTIIAATFMNI
ncbi:MAG: hypothetical protein J1E64_14150 [Acetatifactor sp.]|nr:hypothetical protein [Acetatifactor sp.]